MAGALAAVSGHLTDRGSWQSGPVRQRRIGRLGGTAERPAIFFTGAEEFRSWLEANHATAPELWMGLSKRHVEDRGLRWAEAVPEALAFGWIDSKSEGIDDNARRQRWTPRRTGSTWSLVNVEIVERLLAEGRMTPAGIAAFEARRPDRIGTYSYENEAELTAEHAARLAADLGATAFWDAATPSYRRVCVAWVCSAKQPATRERRMAQLVDDCANGRLIKSQTYGDTPRWQERAAAAARAARAACA
jgi:uncharacterized protein YdeI (YjbR/CyaY-like superfamily)